MPLEHGNGGWYGSELIATADYMEFLTKDPVEEFLDSYYEPAFGSQLRICKDENPNHPLFLFDHIDRCWLNAKGNPIEVEDNPFDYGEDRPLLPDPSMYG